MRSFFQGLQPASAEISMPANPWLGYFAVAEKRVFIFSVTTDGEFGIPILTKGGGEVSVLPISLQFLDFQDIHSPPREGEPLPSDALP